MNIKTLIEEKISAFLALQEIKFLEVHVQPTHSQFEGEYTFVLFPLVKHMQKNMMEIGTLIGKHIQLELPQIASYNIVKGFLNFVISDSYWIHFLEHTYTQQNFGQQQNNLSENIIIEYSSPNTNKPLHLGHLRNNFLGMSMCRIMQKAGFRVFKTSVVNDRGIHISKSMWAWQHFSQGKTPQSEHQKGDHFVGNYYVLFEKELKYQAHILLQQVQAHDFSNIINPKIQQLQLEIENPPEEKKEGLQKKLNELLRNDTQCMQEVKQMLINWENKDTHILALWHMMNDWVYEGFEKTYQRIDSQFDKIYYESNTYLLGKEFIQEALTKNIVQQKEDKSIWIDLREDGLDEKLLLRSDGTSVYITQDLGLADIRYQDFPYTKSIYIVGDEQNYHFQILKLILEKINKPYAKGIYHLSYGMVELPSGKMKSREGTVVDADDLLDTMVKIASEQTKILGKVDDFSEKELNILVEQIGLSALKFFLLRVNPKKKILFNPEESIDLHGFTGPFIQYTYARIQSILRKNSQFHPFKINAALYPEEKELIKWLETYPETIQKSAQEYDPSLIAQYIYQTAKLYNSFY
ncbi:MAG: arginine--tRNA ligase, partial [Chitinophagaceae bacterium]